MILGNYFFHKYVNRLLLRCIDDTIAQKVLREIYGLAKSNIHIGGHFAKKTTTFKILRTCYFCPSIFKYYFKFTRACDKCQKFVGKEKFSFIPLQHVISNFPFSKWGLDFIIPINPLSFVGHIFFLATTYYFTKWTKVVPLKRAQDEQVISFLESNISSCFGLPIEIITDNGPTLSACVNGNGVLFSCIQISFTQVLSPMSCFGFGIFHSGYLKFIYCGDTIVIELKP
jgi:hypothetical protein